MGGSTTNSENSPNFFVDTKKLPTNQTTGFFFILHTNFMNLYESTIYWEMICRHLFFWRTGLCWLRSNSSSKNYGKWKMGISPHLQQGCCGMPFPRVCWRVLVRLCSEFRGVNMTLILHTAFVFSRVAFTRVCICIGVILSSIQMK